MDEVKSDATYIVSDPATRLVYQSTTHIPSKGLVLPKEVVSLYRSTISDRLLGFTEESPATVRFVLDVTGEFDWVGEDEVQIF